MLCIILWKLINAQFLVDAELCLPVHHTMTSRDILTADIWGIAAYTEFKFPLCLASSQILMVLQNPLWEQCYNTIHF